MRLVPRILMRMRWIVFITLGVALATVSPMPAAACSCAPREPLRVATEATDIFSGTVERVDRWFFDRFVPIEAQATVHVRVDRVYKGGLGSAARVETPTQGSACGYDFQAGTRYTIFARDFDANGILNTGLCWENTKGDIEPAAYGLDVGRSPPPSSDGAGWSLPLVAAIVAAAALMVLVLRGRGRDHRTLGT